MQIQSLKELLVLVVNLLKKTIATTFNTSDA